MNPKCGHRVIWKMWSFYLILGGVAVAVYLIFTGNNTIQTQRATAVHGVLLREDRESLPGIDKDQHSVLLKDPKSLPEVYKDPHSTLVKNASRALPNLDTDPYPQNNLNNTVNQHRLTKVDETLCKHPVMELWPPDIKALMDEEESVNIGCSKVEKNWVYIANVHIYIDIGAEKRHGKITCDCTSVERETEFNVNSGAINKDIKNGTRLPSDFIYVNCTASDGKLYNNTHSGVLPHDTDTMSDLPEGTLGLNILMMGFDSVSRLMWQRNLPKTYAYLTESLGAVVLRGYNVAGDGTTRNLLSLLTGMTESELPEARRGHVGAAQVDGYPWIWNELKKLGYVTQWAEDVQRPENNIGGTFTFRMLGFNKQPVDHYMRNFFIYQYEKTRVVQPECFGSVPVHLNMFNWGRDMFESYKVRLKFSFLFHSSLSHNHMTHVSVADEDLRDTLMHMNNRGHFDNTLLLVMSDHGLRFSSVRQTLQGQHEERNPFFSVRLPPKFIAKYPEIHRNLQINAERLTTPFDVHATFHDVILFKGVTKVVANASRGISLFQEIPADRTCEDADLETHWCSCLEWTNVDVKNPNVMASAKTFVEHINELTKDKRELCEELSLHTINRAEKNDPQNELLKFKKIETENGIVEEKNTATEVFYKIQVTTKPSMALYESTVKHLISENTYIVNDKEISRVNAYGDQPHCVAAELPILRPYCYCKIQL